MALTIRNITEEQKQQAMAETGCGTASASLVYLIDLAASRRRVIDQLYKENDELKKRVQHLERVQERLASAADEALCIVRQRELL